MAASAPLIPPSAADTRRFRDVLGLFATGVVAVTAIDNETGLSAGLIANSFTSVSLRPPLVSVCIAHTSVTWPKIRAGRRFAITILAEDQRSVCTRLSARRADKFRGLAWMPSPAGHPIPNGVLGWLDCLLRAEYPAGDHVIAVCHVESLDILRKGRPLICYRGSYGGFSAAARDLNPEHAN